MKKEYFISEEISDFNYFKKAIKPILNLIEKNQNELLNNGPLMSKIGYILENIYSVGRICYGNGKDSLLTKKNQDYNYLADVINNLNIEGEENKEFIYSGWSRHIKNEFKVKYDDFITKIFNKEKVNETKLDKLIYKKQKTFDEWEEMFDLSLKKRINKVSEEELIKYFGYKKQYSYLLGTGGIGLFYNKKTGYIEYENKFDDPAIYGNWKNEELKGDYLKVIKEIIEKPEVKIAFESVLKYFYDIEFKSNSETIKLCFDSFIEILDDKYKNNEKFIEFKNKYDISKIYGLSRDEIHKEISNIGSEIRIIRDSVETKEDKEKRLEEDKIENKRKKEEGEKKVNKEQEYNKRYYDFLLLGKSHIIFQLDKNSHPSNLKGGLKYCKEILNDKNIDFSKEDKNVINYFKTFVKKYEPMFKNKSLNKIR